MAGKKQNKLSFFSSLQGKYAISYLVVFAVVLVLLNTYPVLASQDLLFTSKWDSLKSQTAVMGSALMELETLSSEQVAKVMNMLDSTGVDRILVTDPAGLILYDSVLEKERQKWKKQGKGEQGTLPPEEYRHALSQEVVSALRGNDVFYSQYHGGSFLSTSASPIVYRGQIIGAIYLLDEDEAQGALLLSLQSNLRNISLVIAVVTLVMSAFFSKILTARIAALLRAIRIVGEGEYGHRLQPVGGDELAQLAEEFNHLTDRLQTTEEVRRRFVSDASHELKTPLASIRLLADSILQTDQMDPAMVQDFVTDIGMEADRLTRITEHLLTLTKLDSLPAGKTEPVDLTKVTERVLSMLSPVADAAGVTIEKNMKPQCIVLGTSDEMFQVSYNLIENAIKYNFAGGKVFVSIYRDGEQVILEVGDMGIGIPEEDLPKVFNRFYRVDKARSRAAGGTGLGLSIVRDTVRRHNGWVTARPRHPEGSVFTVGFPQYCPEGQEQEGMEL